MRILGIMLWLLLAPFLFVGALIVLLIEIIYELVNSPVIVILNLINGDPKGARIYFVEWFKSYRDLFVKRSKK